MVDRRDAKGVRTVACGPKKCHPAIKAALFLSPSSEDRQLHARRNEACALHVYIKRTIHYSVVLEEILPTTMTQR